MDRAALSWASKPILHVRRVEVVGPSSLRVWFDNGVVKRVDLGPLIGGGIFEPLASPDYFARVAVDPDAGVTTWPNGADLAPEALFDLPEESEPNGG